MSKLRLLDLYCGAGGAARGYQQAGFHVTGVDIVSQPRYAGDEFHQGDALEYLAAHGREYDAVHASPPCTGHTTMRTTGAACETGWMLAATIGRLRALDRPWVVENVPGASRHMPGAVTVCGTALGLAPLRRHRLFLASFPLSVPPCACRRGDAVVGVYGELTRRDRPANTGRRKPTIRAGVDTARRLMDCPWMQAGELVLAVPPAYTELVGRVIAAECARWSWVAAAEAEARRAVRLAVDYPVPGRSGHAWEAYRLAAGHAVEARRVFAAVCASGDRIELPATSSVSEPMSEAIEGCACLMEATPLDDAGSTLRVPAHPVRRLRCGAAARPGLICPIFSCPRTGAGTSTVIREETR